MRRYLIRRGFLAVLVLWAAVSLTFLILHAAGDPISAEMQASGATEEQIQAALRALGYDRPLGIQYLDFLGSLVRGDLGSSIRFRDGNVALIAERIPFTLWLAIYAMTLAVVVSLVLGLLSAHRPGSLVDRVITAFCSLSLATPSFVFGLFLIIILAVQMRLLPVSGAATPAAVIMPALALSLAPTARFTRLLRGTLLEVSHSEFVTTARAKGVAEWRVTLRHILRNALLPVVTLMALQVSALIGGAVVVESVFGWPGLGTLARDALASRDIPLVQAIVVVTAVVVVVVNLVTDVAYTFIDPRIALQ